MLRVLFASSFTASLMLGKNDRPLPKLTPFDGLLKALHRKHHVGMKHNHLGLNCLHDTATKLMAG